MEPFHFPGQYVHDGIVFHPFFSVQVMESLKDFETTIDDICVATYPRSGTTWTLQILAQMYQDVCDPDASIATNCPFIEIDETFHRPEKSKLSMRGLNALKAKKPPRIFKTHLSLKYFLKNVEGNRLKVIFIIRDVRDMLVSYYHFYLGMGLKGDFDEFFKLFQAKQLSHGDFFEVTESWLKVSHLPNVLILRYEDMKEDLLREIGIINQFCGRNLSMDQLQKIAEKSTFASMKNDPKANYVPGGHLIRKGSVGEWVKYFSEEKLQYLDSVIDKYPEYKAIYNK